MIGVGAKERRTGHKGHPIVDGAFGKHIAIRHLAARPRQARPNKEPAFWLHKLDRITQLFAQGLAHGVGPLGVDTAHILQRGGHTTRLEVVRRSGLRKSAGMRVAELFAHRRAGQQGFGCHHPAHTQAW